MLLLIFPPLRSFVVRLEDLIQIGMIQLILFLLLVIVVCIVDIVDIVHLESFETRERVVEWILKWPLLVDFCNLTNFLTSSSCYRPRPLNIITVAHFKRIIIPFVKIVVVVVFLIICVVDVLKRSR